MKNYSLYFYKLCTALLFLVIIGGIFYGVNKSVSGDGQANSMANVTVLPPPFQAAVDQAIEANLQQQRAYNATTYMKKTRWIEQAVTVTGSQSNKIAELYLKVNNGQ